ncbi:MAG TPA: sugar ABC transporter permease, partial [Anaerolineaceae bacterium]
LKSQRLLIPYLFLLPGLIFFIIFQLYPLFQGIQMSFFNWSIMPTKPSTFIGLANYLRAFNDPIFGTAVQNTVSYTLVTVPAQMILAMAAAVLLNNIRRGKALFRAIYYLPVITSWLIVSFLMRYFFQTEGLVNYYLVDVFHLAPEPVAWLNQAATAFVAIDILGIWKGIGWSMVIYLAALQGIPKELVEAAAIDGANRWRSFFSITLPLMRPTIVFTLVMLLIGGFNVFLSVYFITGGGPMRQTEVMLSYSFHQAFDFLEFGYGAALATIIAIVLVVASYLQLRYLRNPQYE